MPYEIPARNAGHPYRPSDEAEGAMFMSEFCDRCTKDTEETPCMIIFRSLSFDIGEPEYPSEWTHNEKGQPICTAFDRRPAQWLTP